MPSVHPGQAPLGQLSRSFWSFLRGVWEKILDFRLRKERILGLCKCILTSLSARGDQQCPAWWTGVSSMVADPKPHAFHSGQEVWGSVNMSVRSWHPGHAAVALHPRESLKGASFGGWTPGPKSGA